MRDPVKKSAGVRLSRIEGQVRGIARMIAEDRYCIDVINQIEATRAALKKVGDAILRDHIEHCVEGAIVSGDAEDQRRKVAELVQVLAQGRT
ncbi:MAG TPA: metal-sensitive transcriptional regulator [Methylovirgula sp.]|nr:metal-sensitive transcriptional regulator [Methylovirgula sp.]